MSRLLFLLIQLLLFTALVAQPARVIYTCPMHPEVQMDNPGKCPKCGMNLVKKTLKASPQKNVQKPAAKQTTPVQKAQAKPASPAENQQAKPPVSTPATHQTIPGDKSKTTSVYTCVMHPEVQMDKPGNCPKCGMTLIRKTITVTGEGNNKSNAAPADNNLHQHDQTIDQVEADEPVHDDVTSDKVNMEPGKTVVYHLYVTDTIVNFTGKSKHGYAINGSIPAPTLVFTEGDTAEIYLHNHLKKEETSLHWHGVILPNRFDGVPYLTTARIGPGETHLYKFKVVQNGTYWYHSHTALQEQSGMYGALIFKKREPVEAVRSQGPGHHYNVVLSEWADNDPTQIQRRLRTGNDWFSIKKGSTQSYSEAIADGHFKTKFVNEWKRMKAMDVSDVFYDRFLVNGRPTADVPQYKAGDTINLHVVNAGASSYFWLQYAGGKVTVVGNDGNDLEPVEVDRLIIAPAETYDLLVVVPNDMSYEFRATSEDRTGASSLWLGSGMKMPAPKLPRLDYFEGMKMMNDMMNTNGTMKDMGMNMSLQQMDMNMVMYPEITGKTGGRNTGQPTTQTGDNTIHAEHAMPASNTADLVTLNYGIMRAFVSTALPDGPMKVLHFNLTGNMNRYVWTLDNKTVNEADRILIQRGENVRLILTNNSMMRHPMHLHGHDFRVVNQHGDHAPLKNVIDIMPMETDTIEFAANQEGNWFFHCHILYHMMAGMGRVFTYENSPVNPELPDATKAYRLFKRDNNMRHLMVRAGIESNGSDGEAMLSTNRYALQGIWHLGLKPHHGYEAELNFGKYLGVNQWLFPYVGFDYHYKKTEPGEMDAHDAKNMFGQVSNKNNRHTVTAGIQYTTPWLLLADARVDGNGKFRFQVSREDIPITPRLRLNFMGNTDKEYMAGFRYIVSKWMALSTHYDTDMGLGAGITLTY
jgi:CopA family copper-resistance protein